jgi:hypothetical protein
MTGEQDRRWRVRRHDEQRRRRVILVAPRRDLSGRIASEQSRARRTSQRCQHRRAQWQ